MRVVYRNVTGLVEYCPAALRHLPFQLVTRQSLGWCSFPNETPEVFVPARALARLNAPRHDFELFPSLRRCSVPVFSQQVHPVKQHPFVQVSRQSYEPAVHRVVRNELWKVGLDLLFWNICPEVEKVIGENPRPDHVDTINIWYL